MIHFEALRRLKEWSTWKDRGVGWMGGWFDG